MILTDDEMRKVRESIEAQAGWAEELVRRCGPLIHLGRFDEAVRSAFVLLEERLRKAVGEGGMTGTQLANYAFNPEKGPLAKHLAHTPAEREGLRELYSGAFKLFRNPTAHGVVGYSPAEGRAIIGLVDLMLKMLQRVEELPPPGSLPDNVEDVLSQIEEAIGPGAAGRLRVFLGKCVQMGLTTTTATKWIPFRRYALYKPDRWDEPKPHPIAVFYLVATGAEHSIWFPTGYYYADVAGFNLDRLVEELTELGFQLAGKDREPRADLRIHNDQIFFDALLAILTRVVEELDETLRQGES